MKKNITLGLLFVTSIIFAQSSVLGKWKTIDDETGKAKSVIEIYEKSGKIYGKVIEILEVAHKKDLCQNCSGEDKDKAILGITVIKGLSKEDGEYTNGNILDPKNGKVYKCTITADGSDKLKVRGYIGFSLLGRTQYWYKLKS